MTVVSVSAVSFCVSDSVKSNSVPFSATTSDSAKSASDPSSSISGATSSSISHDVSDPGGVSTRVSGECVLAAGFVRPGEAFVGVVVDSASVSTETSFPETSSPTLLFVRSRRGTRRAFAFITGVLTGTSRLTTSSSTSLPTMDTVPPSLRLWQMEGEGGRFRGQIRVSASDGDIAVGSGAPDRTTDAPRTSSGASFPASSSGSSPTAGWPGCSWRPREPALRCAVLGWAETITWLSFPSSYFRVLAKFSRRNGLWDVSQTTPAPPPRTPRDNMNVPAVNALQQKLSAVMEELDHKVFRPQQVRPVPVSASAPKAIDRVHV